MKTIKAPSATRAPTWLGRVDRRDERPARVPGFVRRAPACFLSRARRVLCLVYAWRVSARRRRICAPRAPVAYSFGRVQILFLRPRAASSDFFLVGA